MLGYLSTTKSQQPPEDRSYYNLRRVLERKKAQDEAKALIISGAQVNSPHGRPCNTILHLAIINGDYELVKMVLDKGGLINMKNTHGKTPLHTAVELGKENIVELLIAKSAYVNTIAEDLSTPIQAAVVAHRSKICEILVRNGAEVNIKFNNGQTLFYTAVQTGSTAIVEFLLKHGRINKEDNKVCLRLAIMSRNQEIDRLLLQHNFQLDSESISDEKFFHIIIRKGYFKLVGDLLSMGAKINSPAYQNNSDGFTLLHTACKYQQYKITELLILFGINLNIKDKHGKMAINYAVSNWDVDIINLLVINNALVKNDLNLLIIAVYKQDYEIVLLLLDHDADVNVRDIYGRTPLYLSVNKRFWLSHTLEPFNGRLSSGTQLAIIELLLKRGTHVNAQTIRGDTALHEAVRNNNEEIVKILLEYNAEVNVSNSEGITPLHLAVEKKNLTIVNNLLSRNADVKAVNDNGSTALHFAAETGELNIVESLLKYNSDVNAIDNFSSTPLHYSIMAGSLDCVSILLDHNADVNAFDISGSTALHLAVGTKQIEIVEVLLKSNANTELINENGDTCLHISVKHDLKITKLLLDYCTEIDCVDKNGLTPLLIAAMRSPDMIACLIDHGADLNFSDPQGRNALHLSVIYCKLESMVNLLEKHADVNCKDAEGLTPLLVAISSKNLLFVNTLLQYNADVNYTGHKNKPPLHFAIKTNKVEIISNLLIYGADVNFVNDEGLTALLIEIDSYYFWNTDVIEVLLKFGADTEMRTREGKTALFCATEKQQIDLVKILLNYGADMSVLYENKVALLHMYKFNPSNDYSSSDFGCEEYGSQCDNYYYRKNQYVDVEEKFEEFCFHVSKCERIVGAYKEHIRKMVAIHQNVDRSTLKAVKYFKKLDARRDNPYDDKSYDIDLGDYDSESDTVDESNFEDNDDDSGINWEVEAMKNEKIGSSSITFYNLLTSNLHRVARYIKNKDVIDVVKSGDYELIFPTYAGMITARFYSGLEREKLLEKCDYFHQFVHLPFCCIDEIFGHLSNQDLRMMIDAYKSESIAGKRKYNLIS